MKTRTSHEYILSLHRYMSLINAESIALKHMHIMKKL